MEAYGFLKKKRRGSRFGGEGRWDGTGRSGRRGKCGCDVLYKDLFSLKVRNKQINKQTPLQNRAAAKPNNKTVGDHDFPMSLK